MGKFKNMQRLASGLEAMSVVTAFQQLLLAARGGESEPRGSQTTDPARHQGEVSNESDGLS